MTNDKVVHVVDDDADVRHSMAFLLSTAGYSVGAYDLAMAFLAALPASQAGCVVTDIRMPGMDGLELQRRLRAEASHLPVIVMTGHGDVPLAVEAMKAGAVDFIEKPFDDATLLNAIRFAFERQSKDFQRNSQVVEIRRLIDGLTPRERDVLGGLVAGKPNKIIAYDLGISPGPSRSTGQVS